MKNIALPEFTVLSDHYELQEEELADLFALDVRLGPLFDILRHKETDAPLSMAVYGQTGTGKTTALRWLVNRLKEWNAMPAKERAGHPWVLPVWFSASGSPSHEGAVCKLVSTILLTCLENLPDEKDRAQFLEYAADRCVASLGKSFLTVLECVASQWGLSDVLEKLAVRANTEYGCGSLSFESCIEFVARWQEGHRKKKDDVRIAVFVDDLDHCDPDLMMSIFTAMSSQFHFPAVVFVAGLDAAVAQTLINRHFREHGYDEVQSRHYLSKIFQVECHIEPSHKQVRKFYKRQIDRLNAKTGGMLEKLMAPVHRSAIDAAIWHLSNNNPRKLKLLLNSALMRGYGASRLFAEEELSLEQAQRLFCQCVQMYLLQRWLSYFSVGASAIHRQDVLKWFTVLSEEACNPKKNYQEVIGRHLSTDENAPFRRPAYKSPEEMEREKLLIPPEGLGYNMVPEWVWELLKIPFDANVINFSNDPVELKVFEFDSAPEPDAAVEAIDLASSMLRDAVAAALEKSIRDLSAEDFMNVANLDLSGQQVSDSDLAVIGMMVGLKRIDLYNSGIKTLDWVVGLKNIKVLNLTCTGVFDLSPLAGLTELQSLDLSYTPAEDLSPLEGKESLTSLVLYGAPVKTIDPLKGLAKLTRLNLSHTGVTESGLEIIETLTALETLFLRGTSIKKESAAHLNQVLGFNLKIEI